MVYASTESKKEKKKKSSILFESINQSKTWQVFGSFIRHGQIKMFPSFYAPSISLYLRVVFSSTSPFAIPAGWPWIIHEKKSGCKEKEKKKYEKVPNRRRKKKCPKSERKQEGRKKKRFVLPLIYWTDPIRRLSKKKNKLHAFHSEMEY